MADISTRVQLPPQRVDTPQARDGNVSRRVEENSNLRTQSESQNTSRTNENRQTQVRQNETRQSDSRQNDVRQDDTRQVAEAVNRATENNAPNQSQQINSAQSRRQISEPTGLAAEERARDAQQASQLRLDPVPSQEILQNNASNSQPQDPPPRGQIVDVLA